MEKLFSSLAFEKSVKFCTCNTTSPRKWQLSPWNARNLGYVFSQSWKVVEVFEQKGSIDASTSKAKQRKWVICIPSILIESHPRNNSILLFGVDVLGWTCNYVACAVTFACLIRLMSWKMLCFKNANSPVVLLLQKLLLFKLEKSKWIPC